LANLRKQSTLTRLETKAEFLDGSPSFAGTEGNWVMFQTGVRAKRSGYWETIRYCPATYRATNDFTHGGYDYKDYPPFYALGDQARVAIFDIPLSAVVPNVQGSQIVGWGGHFPYVVRGSDPRGLLKETNRRFGKNRIIYRDHGVFWSRRYRKWLEETAIQATKQRERIILDLLDDTSLDLIVAAFGETHSVLHDLWAQSDEDHPVNVNDGQPDPLLQVFTAIDETIGSIIKRLRPDDHLVVFSVHGIQQNSTDLPCLFFLPELMYRFNFPGKFGFARGDSGTPAPPVVRSGLHWYWFGEIWRQKYCSWRWLSPILRRLPAWYRWTLPGSDFKFPFFLSIKGPTNGWMPTTWYRPSWQKSRSFALPSFANGHVRINVVGRDQRGVVPPSEYDSECDRISDFLKRLTNGRTGEPIVKDIFRTRRDPTEEDEKMIAGDLVVVWTDVPFDVVDSPDVGRIGPVPYFRTGGHRAGGFAMLHGPRFEEGATIDDHEVVDLAPTILETMGLSAPSYFDGSAIQGSSN
jgi:predicted AlkP superfamily phosphohydrolase/phosphomutase